ncbi:Clp protease N-terminal domain-containing protein [Raineyella sp. LH-20]|uniref:Clp protease N-terminal domain-containing protein n=1 Tax=Raineyella sp. LH-20 TaxID=3081204 RepID=UPI002953BC3D|nr:Clp protease N-terminal domain-containing protein [Raineyella sp. LH-20]WOP17683.1 Clp protease N-terminal domain-containing protein [Raineyella sp. LH-20]
MFERFTEEARRVVRRAEGVADELRSAEIGPGHLLVALVETSPAVRTALVASGADPRAVIATGREVLRAGGLDSEALASLGVDLEQVRQQADAVFGDGALDRVGRGGTGRSRFDRNAKKTLELALRETIRLQDRTIESRHLCLAVLREGGEGRVVLERSSVDSATLRSALETPQPPTSA